MKHEVLNNHKYLSNKNSLFIEYINKNKELLRRDNFLDITSEHSFSNLNLNPWPTFISKEIEDYFQKTAIEIFNLIKIAHLRVFNNDLKRMSIYYSIPVEQLEIMLDSLPANYIEILLGRGDFVIDSNNELKCIEYNVAAALGGWQIDYLTSIYQKSTLIAEFIKKNDIKLKESNFFFNLFEHIRNAIERLDIDNESRVVNIAFITSAQFEFDPRGLEEISILKRNFEKYKNENKVKGEIIYCTYDKLEIRNNSSFYNGMIINCIVEWDTYTPLRFLGLIKNKKTLILNSNVTFLLTSKFNLSLLSEYQDSNLFNDDEKKLIENFIPWCRKLIDVDIFFENKKYSLVNLVINNQEKFVLKAAFGSQGEDVFVGKNISSEIWEQKILEAVKEKKWIIQEYIKPQEYWYQINENSFDLHEAIFGLFTFGNRYAGGFVRMLSSNNKDGVINSKRGASESTILVIE